VSVHDGDPFLGKVFGLAQRDALCDEEAARSADYDDDDAGSTGLLDAFDEAIRSADDLTSVVRLQRGPWHLFGYPTARPRGRARPPAGAERSDQ
jgi:hypothetical protein